jgi:dTDP-4-dehydrorhamnose reductase
MRFLLFGGTGQVAAEFRNLPLPAGVTVAAPGRGALDLGDTRAITAAVAAEPWSAVINAAAYASRSSRKRRGGGISGQRRGASTAGS